MTSLPRPWLRVPRGAVPRVAWWALYALVAAATLAQVPGRSGVPPVGAAVQFTPPADLAGEQRHVTFFSAALGHAVDYWLYLPPGYASSAARYAVLYLLHGRDASSAQWKDLGAFWQADRLIQAGTIAPLLIVTPQGDNGYWMNDARGGARWGDFITHDLIAHIDRTYRTRPEPAQRAIGGISMGGHGAIQLALNHPGLFAAVGGHSAVFRSEADALPCFGNGAAFRQRDPVSLVLDGQRPVDFALWLDIGASDPWAASATAFHELLDARGIAHHWQRPPGGHEDAFWASYVAEYLVWYSVILAA